MARQVLGGEEPQSGSHQVVAGVHLPILLKGRSLTRHEVDFLHTVELVSIQPLQTDGIQYLCEARMYIVGIEHRLALAHAHHCRMVALIGRDQPIELPIEDGRLQLLVGRHRLLAEGKLVLSHLLQSYIEAHLAHHSDIDAELAKRETTENREFALGARAVAGIAEAKEWAWNEALHNDELTNMQLESVARGFASTPRADLAEPYAAKYFEVADWIWKNKTFHMAEALLEGLYPSYADPATLVELGDAWLASHADADNALQRIVRGNVESSHRTLKVRDFNASL